MAAGAKPDTFLRPFLDDYERLAVLHQIVANAYRRKALLIRELMRKTEALVRSRAQSSGIAPAKAPIKLDEDSLRALKAKQSDDGVKVVNLGGGILQALEAETDRQPHLRPMAERAEAILEAYDDRQVSTGQALNQLTELVEEYLKAQTEAQRLGLDPPTFAIYWLLQSEGIENALALAGTAQAAFHAHGHFRDSADGKRALRVALYKELLPATAPETAKRLVNRLIETHKP